MPIYQTNLFICEVCGQKISHTTEADLYDDPVVTPPIGWNYPEYDPNTLYCDSCIARRADESRA